jgi:hypothetical protein
MPIAWGAIKALGCRCAQTVGRSVANPNPRTGSTQAGGLIGGIQTVAEAGQRAIQGTERELTISSANIGARLLDVFTSSLRSILIAVR